MRYHGYVERLAPHHDAFATDPEGWLELLGNAAALIDTPAMPVAVLADAAT